MSKKSTTQKKRVFLVEDHTVLREVLRRFINIEPDMEVCGEAGNAADAHSMIAMLRPDAVLSDLSMPGTNGIEFIKKLKADHPMIASVVLSMHDENLYAERALRSGALGYVMKSSDMGEILVALRKAFKGENHFSEKISGSLLRKAVGGRTMPVSHVGQLTDRELEVFEQIGLGLGTSAIASAMGLSPKTVETHRAHIKEKLGIVTISELIQQAAVWVNRQNTGG